MNERYKDTDLREALRRKHADTPQLPADFMAKMQERMKALPTGEAGQTEARPVARTRRLWQWTAAAACLLFMIGIGLTLLPETKQDEPLLAKGDAVQQTERVVAGQISEEPEVTKETADNGNSLQRAVSQHERSRQPADPKPAVTKSAPDGQTETAVEEASPVIAVDPNVHYAALTQTDDTVAYQPPCRVDDFIAKLAEYNEVKGVPLKCSSDGLQGGNGADSTIVSTAYLFPDTQELDLFGRLLQVACWYDTKTPGYLLNFSHRQFVFCLEDLREGQKYLWIAERIGSERILLFATHSPIDTSVSSACFQDYREQLTHKGINILQF
jgi:hypothetical protein